MGSFKINPDMMVLKSRDPYFHIIIDNFFDASQLRELLSDWPSEGAVWNTTRKEINKKANLLESGIRAINSTDKLTTSWKNFFNFVHHEDVFANCIRNLVNEEGIAPDETYNWSGLRENFPSSYQLIHSDALIHPVTGFEKRFTVMIYFDDPKVVREGDLELWDNEMSSCKVSIQPFFNRVVIFECTPTSYHGVPKCDYLRRAFTMSFVNPVAKKNYNRKKAEFVARPFDTKEVAAQGVLRGKVK